MVLYLLILALAAILLKDALYFGAISDVLRLGFMAAAGLAGVAVVVGRLASVRWSARWPLGAYLLTALVPVTTSYDPPYVLFEVASIGAAVVAGMAIATPTFGATSLTLLRATALIIAVAVDRARTRL
jgi:hypothetical protein